MTSTPNSLKDAFLDAVVAFDLWRVGEPVPTVRLNGRLISIFDLCGALWNCDDRLPPEAWATLLDAQPQRRSRTVSAAARWMRREINLHLDERTRNAQHAKVG